MAARDTDDREYIREPLYELLAIKLYEHTRSGLWPDPSTSWWALAESSRKYYRQIARGQKKMPHMYNESRAKKVTT